MPPVALIAVATSWKLSPMMTGVVGTPVTTTDATPAGPVTGSSPQDMSERALAATQKRAKARRETENGGVLVATRIGPRPPRGSTQIRIVVRNLTQSAGQSSSSARGRGAAHVVAPTMS